MRPFDELEHACAVIDPVRVAHHEAGHSVVSYVIGLPIGQCEI
jgi:hypothetical protein